MNLKYLQSICLLLLLSNISYLSAQHTGQRTQGLKKLATTSEIYYSNGYEVRARTIQEFLTESIAFYKSEFPEIVSGIEILILDKNDWTARFIDIPYGIPFFDAEKRIVIPADKFTASSELGYEDLSTDHELSEYDKFIISILGQSYIIKNRETSISDTWMRDLIATYFAVSFFEVNDFVWDLKPDQSEDITQKSLNAYNRLHKELPAANYYWYQSRYIEVAKMLFNLGGFQLLGELLDHFQLNGSLDEAEAIISKYSEKEYPEWKASMN